MRTRGATAVSTATVEASEEDESLSTAPRLKFSESLSWRVGKPIATGELLRRLQAFSKELQGLEQGQVDNEALAKYAPHLVPTNILSHKDKGVRAWAACCLVDILRLCAPDAPFTTPQLNANTLPNIISVRRYTNVVDRTSSTTSSHASSLASTTPKVRTMVSIAMSCSRCPKSRVLSCSWTYPIPAH